MDGNPHPWLRMAPTLIIAGSTLGPDLLVGARLAAGAVAGIISEASPAVIAGSAAGVSVLAAGGLVWAASSHYESQEHRLRDVVQQRGVLHLKPEVPWQVAAGTLLKALQWHLLPQLEGLPHVYHGSVWRTRAREEHLEDVRSLLREPDEPGEDQYADEAPPAIGSQMWGDLIFSFALWLEFNPHTANWGSCKTYGPPPTHMCWHNRWREDMRHVLAGLALHFSEQLPTGVAYKERASVLCLLGALDHVLSWDVTSLHFGSSDLIPAAWYSHSSFCQNCGARIAEAWGAAQAPPEAEVDLRSFEVHVEEVMAQREVPPGLRNAWQVE